VTKYVFDARDAIRYRFPTHTNDLILDRKDATSAEAFFVILEPGETVPLHVHSDAEQVFFILEGAGEMGVSASGLQTGLTEYHPLKVGDFVRTPPATAHSVRNTGATRLVYLSIDCFVAGADPAEPSWDSHVRQMCIDHGWDFDEVRRGPVEDERYLPDMP
jgi:mannose-6-phosphate isomerase-like protein (cupin superfamily)